MRKGNPRRHLPGAETWCAAHPDAGFIPMYVTGHDSIWRWRCHAGKAVPTGEPERLDRRGFIARYWKRLP